MSDLRENFKNKKRIVVKIGSSSINHPESGGMDFSRIELLVRQLCDIHNSGKDVVLVSSGAIAAGKYAIGYGRDRSISHELTLPQKQACAAIGQGRLMNIYEKFFTEYNQLPAQVLMTKDTVLNDGNRNNATNTFKALLDMGVIPIVNENDTIATNEIEIGDNDTLSAMVASMVGADLLILLSDIEGLYTDDPNKNPEAKFIKEVPKITSEYLEMGKGSTGTGMGTGGMCTKLNAARIAAKSGADMVICSSKDLTILSRIIAGEDVGTAFAADPDENFKLQDFISEILK
ncbi:MAG: glutamate 5-kinase [Lachnospiraceae bacterium]|nr:glutamate 5-kinase [Lachnospiraceae bacterium]